MGSPARDPAGPFAQASDCTTPTKATVSNLAVLSLKNRALIALITIVAAVFGGLALTSLKQELIPSIEFPQLVVVSSYPGASPEVVSNDVSVPIETAIQGVSGLESTSATSTTNSSIIQASFTYGTNLATAEQKITQAINRIKSQLPEGVEPTVISASIDDFPVIQLAVTGYDDEESIQAQLETTIVPEIEDVAGVNAAQIVGGVGQRVTITPDQAALAEAGYSSQAIRDALDQNGVLFPGGEITENGETLTVQTGSKIGSVDEIAALPLVPSDAAQFASGPQTIGDVATVEQNQDPITTISRVNGEPALTIAVTKLPAANTVDVSRGVLAVLPELEDSLGGATFTVVFDQAPYIQESIDTLAKEGLLGLFFAVLVILVFLMSVRATLVTAISIPTSVLITFIGIQAFGYSLNILTLGALTISIGRVVDDSIVVIENIKRHYVGDAAKLPSILRAVREVASAITASTITTVAVFLPIAFVGDVTGELFRPFALTVTIAMTASLFVALTIVPVLAYWFLRPGKPILDEQGRQVDAEDPAAPPSRLQRSYLPILRWTLKHSWVTLLLAVLVLAGTVAAAPFMKTNFLGDSGQNTFTMTQEIGAAPSLEAEDAASEQVEAVLLDIEGIETVQVSIGSSGSALRDAFTGGGSGITYSITTDPGVDQVALREEVQAAVAELDDAGEITVAAGGGGFGSSDIEIDVTAPDAATLQEATDAVVGAVTGADGIGQVSSNLSASLPYIAVVVDRDEAAALGLSEVAVGAIVSAAMQPQSIGTVEIDETTLTVYLAEFVASDDTRRAPPAHRAQRGRSDPARRRGLGRGERRPHVDHDRGRPAHRDGDRDAVDGQPHRGIRLGEHGARGRRAARRGRRLARRRHLPAAGCVHPARPRSAGGDPHRLHRHGGDVQVVASAAAPAGLGAVRGDRRDPAADHHRRAPGRRLAHRRADADRHRGDQRDRARRPREPIPHARTLRLRRHDRGWLAATPADPDDGARDDLRADPDGPRHHRAGRIHLPAARHRRDRRSRLLHRADPARAADSLQPRRGCEGTSRRPTRRGNGCRRRRPGARSRWRR